MPRNHPLANPCQPHFPVNLNHYIRTGRSWCRWINPARAVGKRNTEWVKMEGRCLKTAPAAHKDPLTACRSCPPLPPPCAAGVMLLILHLGIQVCTAQHGYGTTTTSSSKKRERLCIAKRGLLKGSSPAGVPCASPQPPPLAAAAAPQPWWAAGGCAARGRRATCMATGHRGEMSSVASSRVCW